MSRINAGTAVNFNGVPVGVSTPPASSFTGTVSAQQLMPRSGPNKTFASQSLGVAPFNSPTSASEGKKNSFATR